ncbi:MAG: TonB family protein [Methylococcales bacterium]|jgi:protein TonB|nr:energy transducer TonB [Methylococcales bacterium]
MPLTIPQGISNHKLLLALALSLLIHLAILTPLRNPITTPSKLLPPPIHITLNKTTSRPYKPITPSQPIKNLITTASKSTQNNGALNTPLKQHPPSPRLKTPPPKPRTKTALKPTLQKGPKNLSVNTLVQQISDMGRNISNQSINAKNSRIKFSNSISSSHQYKALYYIKQWQAKVERIGNLNYPAIAQTPGFRGTLLIDAGINPDGSLYSIRVRQSSGNKALDEAALKIVRMGAPYSPLPEELLNEIDVLVISRVWQFSDETGISTSQ